ncbi:beta-lactamase family protein [Tardiphaga sp. vice352]|uniref:serine hydrolase domain-containing protein n=1 Tax=unclassified Tardiphaga TaxID=2631404 RepID=UPI001162C007|nr:MULTISPECIES: serine hydrolase domain-containing protein [unclassified Tardiphaga]QDM17701.1 beta-lactamase family protein [Tardiphaga sp. vice278]QDM22761.1 beta-lactamase family protein [Tardiphaga sp. vice154]QDM27920.1 beta-lactamase family protein [Tardiphaga sp. vice304]QDM33062.1 beta-lactamase family protein [Tardiphaga sp. vice352]
MEPWVQPAIDYFRLWMDFQIRSSQQPGCIIAIAHRGKIISEFALGHANLVTGEKMTPRHRFRIASHSKSFTAAGIMKLRERRRLRLDDPVGHYVEGLHPQVADTTIGQILSHSAGLTRDGADAGQFTGQRPFLSPRELLAELAVPPAIAPGTRLKYSNIGFGLLGMVIENITHEPYRTWIEREIVETVGLRETEAATPLARAAPMAGGHTPLLPLGRRLVVPGDIPQHAITPAGGFVSTAADVARFFAQLSPQAKNSVLSPASRREMTRRHWRNPDSTVENYYGLGIMSGSLAGWDWFGHSGGLQGYISRTAMIPACDLTIVVLSNASDGWAWFWLDGALHILRAFAKNGAPTRRVRDWTGRWWTASGATDLVPMGNRVLVGSPVMGNPFMDATEIEVTGRDTGRIVQAAGYASYGQAVRRSRSKAGKVIEVWLAGSKLRPEKAVIADMERRYGHGRPARR